MLPSKYLAICKYFEPLECIFLLNNILLSIRKRCQHIFTWEMQQNLMTRFNGPEKFQFIHFLTLILVPLKIVMQCMSVTILHYLYLRVSTCRDIWTNKTFKFPSSQKNKCQAKQSLSVYTVEGKSVQSCLNYENHRILGAEMDL